MLFITLLEYTEYRLHNKS